MAFKAEKYCSSRIQRRVGLEPAIPVVPRVGDKTARGEAAYDGTQCHAHNDAIPRAYARRCWLMIPDATKNDPLMTAEDGAALQHLAYAAGFGPTNRMEEVAPQDQIVDLGVTFYQSPGGHMITGKDSSAKFISFLNKNMDGGTHRILWYNLTGREQFEWIKRWYDLGCPFARVAGTVGLAGTNLHRLKTQDDLNAAILYSPSIIERVDPDHPHPDLKEAHFTEAQRVLDMQD